MKMHLSPHNIILFFALLALVPASVMAGNGGDLVEKKKTISKSYNVSAGDKLNIENSFGNVVINTWDKNEIKVDVEMAANASTDEKAQKILDAIEVTEGRKGSDISFKTNVSNIHDNDHHNKDKDKERENNRTFYIDYTVYMPKVNPLDIENQFGKITLPDFSGLANITSKFGGLTAGKLDNVDAIDVEFGTAQIAQVHNGKVTFKFDNNSGIGKVSGSVKINSEFSNHIQFTVENAIEDLSINESYSSIRMVTSVDLSASFDIHTSFGHFKNDTEFKIKEDREDDDENSGPRFDKDFHGKANAGNAKIKIKSSFGSVHISHTASVGKDNDDNDERSERPERKERKERKEKKEKEVTEKEEVSL
jgi:hypothetical protein